MDKKKEKKIETVLSKKVVKSPMDVLMQQIRIGTANEIKDAWFFAEMVTKGKEYPQIMLDNVQQILAVSSLYLMYAHSVKPKLYPQFPTVSDLISFLSVSVVEEEVFDEETNENHVQIVPKTFIDLIRFLIDFPVTNQKGVTLVYLNAKEEEVKHKNFTTLAVRNLYPSYQSILDCEPSLHPYLFSEFSMLLARDWKDVMEAVNLAIIILTKQRYGYV